MKAVRVALVNPIESRANSLRRNWPALLSLATHHAALLWMWSRDFPMYGSDGMVMKQLAIELAQRGHFLSPTFFGVLPHAEEFMATYPPFYSYLNALVFAVLGTSFAVGLTFDLLLQAGVVTAAMFALYRCGVPAWLNALLPWALFHMIIPFGRPEILIALLLMGALALVAKDGRWRWGAALLIGIAGACNPVMGVAGVVLALGLVRAMGTPISPLLFGQAAFAGAVTVALCAPLFPADFSKLFEQFRGYLVISGDGSPKTVFLQAPLFFVSMALLLVGLGSLRPSNASAAAAPLSIRFARSLAITIPICMLLLVVGNRLWYHHRVFAFIVVPAALVHFVWLDVRWKKAFIGGAIAIGALGNGIPASRNLAASLVQEPHLPKYGEVVARIAAVIPPDATVGAQGELWGLNVTHRQYREIHCVTPAPDYVISTTWANPPGALSYVPNISEYEEISGVAAEYTPGCAIKLGPLKLPIARGTCGWNARVWRRK